MKKFLIPLCALLAAACGAPVAKIALLPAESFRDTVDGRAVDLYTLRGGDLTMQVTNYGARVVALWTPDREGRMEDIVLGYENLDRYLRGEGERFLGATVGPFANRIASGRFTLDGVSYTLPRNDRGQTLHGGERGIDRVVWEVVDATDSTLTLSYLHADAQEGFPGNKQIRMTYSLSSDNAFRIDYRMTTDRPTVVNLTHHPFFNLKGEGRGTILDHVLTIRASHYTPIDSVSIPTGAIAPVEGTPFDFRQPHTVGERIGAADPQLANGSGYDHNWAIDRTGEGIEPMAELWEPASGRTVEVWSDQPGLQFYSGNFFDGAFAGKYGRPLRYRESVALEAQRFPDSPNRPDFPACTLRPGETYTQTCIYRFGTR